ncbi:M24 family metallopeptidase [Candidatus Woesearchaeota archaeon]|nr:M24 family metallopeptidase [Candidatus Woesearchaeota archaeon]
MALILQGEELEKAKEFLREAYKTSRIIFENASRIAKKGERILEIELMAEQEILRDFKLAFPPQVSIGNIAAHSCQELNSDETIREGNIKLDIGIMNDDGLIFDTAKTFLGEERMIKAVEEALLKALKLATPGRKLGEIGKTIEETARKYGLKPIRNLGGHGLDKFMIHSNPSIPNYDNKSEEELVEGMLIAIEPFITSGEGLVREKGRATIFSIKPNARARSNSARMLINKYPPGVPFSLRDVDRLNAKIGFIELVRNNMLYEYPPLVEISKAPVVQAETTIIVMDKPFYHWEEL